MYICSPGALFQCVIHNMAEKLKQFGNSLGNEETKRRLLMYLERAKTGSDVLNHVLQMRMNQKRYRIELL